jgi:Flp pilus assembly protein TadG
MRGLKRVLGSVSGHEAVIFAIVTSPIMLGISAATGMSRLNKAKAALRAAADAAVPAGGLYQFVRRSV